MIDIEGNTLSHERIAVAYRAIGIVLLYILWAKTDRDMAGLFLLLLLLILMLLRWRFPKLEWTLVIDQLAVITTATVWENGVYALTLDVFEAVYLGCPVLIIPAIFYMTFYRPEMQLGLMFVQGIFAGLGLWGWCRLQQSSLKRMDSDSKRYYELESLKQELLAANVQVAKIAELSERSRIAREIHDNAGHEIVAAYMSLQTVQDLLKADTAEAEELFHESIGRLESGIGKIREAVHNLAPLTDMGVNALRKICEEFTHCPVELMVYGDPSRVPIYLWVILEACLKESLTNILRHADAKSVNATLDITPHIVRLCVENDGAKKNAGYTGLGLRNLQQRAKAVGGNISTALSDSFRLICVLPIN